MAYNQGMNVNQGAEDQFLQLLANVVDNIPQLRQNSSLQEEVNEQLEEIENALSSGRVTTDVLMKRPIAPGEEDAAMNSIFAMMNQNLGRPSSLQRDMSRRLYEIIIQSYPDEKINDGDMIDGKTLLHMALEYDSPDDVIRELFASGADANVQDREGRTPLHVAVSKFNPERVRLLIEEKGADPDLRDREGKSPLQELERIRMNPRVARQAGAIRGLLERHMTTRNNNYKEGGRRRRRRTTRRLKSRKGKTRHHRRR
jgi:hypothetical protein